jgi:hypothetical protein
MRSRIGESYVGPKEGAQVRFRRESHRPPPPSFASSRRVTSVDQVDGLVGCRGNRRGLGSVAKSDGSDLVQAPISDRSHCQLNSGRRRLRRTTEAIRPQASPARCSPEDDVLLSSEHRGWHHLLLSPSSPDPPQGLLSRF